ncbi:MAG: hypothetical protein ACYDD1_12675 [Caulobacteraceae bacterium]
MAVTLKTASASTISLAFLFTAGHALAQPSTQPAWSPQRFAVGVSAGSDGAGGDVQYLFLPRIVLRARGTWLGFSYTGDAGQLNYKAKFNLSEVGTFVDLHPFKNAFTLSMGTITGPRSVDLTGTYLKTLTYKGITYTPAQLGQAAGRASLSGPAPYAAIGFDNTFTTKRRFGFKILVGASFGSRPDPNLAAVSGLAKQYPTLIAPTLATAERDIRRYSSIFAYYPQVSAGVTYRF